MAKNYRVFLKERPGVDGFAKEEHFGFEECSYPDDELEAGGVLIKNLYLSVDPAQRCMMNEDTGAHYLQPIQIGETIDGVHGVGTIAQSQNDDFTVGDLVYGKLKWPWTSFFVMPKDSAHRYLSKLDRNLLGDKPYLPLSLFGMIGLTALIAIQEGDRIKPGANQTCVVTGAAGASGSLAGQIAKLEGCARVVGICGTQEKCDWLTNDLGFDAAVNYKLDGLEENLQKACPNGIDIYYDNVGGAVTNCIIKQMNKNAHVILCGAIAVYNQSEGYPPELPDSIVQIMKEKNITRERFLIVSHVDKFESGIQQLAELYLQGKLKTRETITKGLENVGAAFVSMMSGGNIGKQIVQVSEA